MIRDVVDNIRRCADAIESGVTETDEEDVTEFCNDLIKESHRLVRALQDARTIDDEKNAKRSASVHYLKRLLRETAKTRSVIANGGARIGKGEATQFCDSWIAESRKLVESIQVASCVSNDGNGWDALRNMEREYLRLEARKDAEAGRDPSPFRDLSFISDDKIRQIVDAMNPIFDRRASQIKAMISYETIDLGDSAVVADVIRIMHRVNLFVSGNEEADKIIHPYFVLCMRIYALEHDRTAVGKDEIVDFMRWVIRKRTLFTYFIATTGTRVWTRPALS